MKINTQIFQTLSALQAAALAALYYVGMVTPVVLLVTAALLGINHSVWQPVRMTLIPKLVAPAEIPTAVAVTSMLANIARIVGPAIAGPIILFGSLGLAFAMNALSFLVVVVILQAIRLSPDDTRARLGGGPDGGVWHGVAVVAAHPGMRPLFLLIAAFAITVRPVADLLPAFAETVFDRGPDAFAALISAMGLGALFAGFILSWIGVLKSLSTVLAIFGLLGAASTALFAVTSNFTLALFWMGLVGLGVTGKNIAAQTLLQLSLDDAVRGRVFSFYIVLFSAAPAVGAFAIGVVADRIGLPTPVFVSALIGLGAAILVFLRRHRLEQDLTETADTAPPNKT